jgi:hypothetical protein
VHAAEAYWDGTNWMNFSDPNGRNSMGMAGISGWTHGTAAILFNGNVQSQINYAQPTAASIWTN